MNQDWDAVAAAITDRMHELGMRQRDLANIADVGLSTVQELASNTAPRRRNPTTLAAISEALQWPAGYLHALATGNDPDTADPRLEQRIAKLESDVAEILRRLDQL